MMAAILPDWPGLVLEWQGKSCVQCGYGKISASPLTPDPGNAAIRYSLQQIRNHVSGCPADHQRIVDRRLIEPADQIGGQWQQCISLIGIGDQIDDDLDVLSHEFDFVLPGGKQTHPTRIAATIPEHI